MPIPQIVRFIEYFKGVVSPLKISIILFGVIPFIFLLFLSYYTDYYSIIFNVGVLFSLIWLSLSTYLIRYGYLTLQDFFERNSDLVEDTKHLEDLKREIFGKNSDYTFSIFSIPLIIIADIVLLKVFQSAPLVMKLWVLIVFSLLFLFAGIGFWGVLVMVQTVREFVSLKLKVNPFHPDGFGGMKNIGNFSVTISILFSTGSLVFPLVFHIVRNLAVDYLCSIVIGVVSLFVFFVIISFLIPIYYLSTTAAEYKRKWLSEAESTLKRMFDQYIFSTENQDINLEKLSLYYEIHYKRIKEMRDNPFSLPIIFEFIGSVTLPIIIAISEFL